MTPRPLGEAAFGQFPYGGASLLDQPAPTVTATAAGSFTAGPVIDLTYDYSQPGGYPATVEKLSIVDTTTGATVYTASSNQVVDAGAAGVFAVNVVDAGLDPNTSGGRYNWTVTAYTEGERSLAGSASATFDLQLGQPTISITEPTNEQILAGPLINVAWTYSDLLNIAQGSFDASMDDPSRVQVTTTGVVDSTATATSLVYLPDYGTSYTITVKVTNANGIPTEASVIIVGAAPATGGQVDLQYEPSATTVRLYSRLASYLREADAAQTNPPHPLLSYMSLVGDQMGDIEVLLDRFQYIAPDRGGPPPGSGLAHSTSELVDPFLADDTWLTWLATMIGVPRSGRTLGQWRVAMGTPQRAWAAGSRQAIIDAVQALYAHTVSPVQLVEGATVVNAPYSAQPQVLPLFSASPQPDGCQIISTLGGFEMAPAGATNWNPNDPVDYPMGATVDASDPVSLSAFSVDDVYTFRTTVSAPFGGSASLTASFTGASTTATQTVEASVGPDGTTLSLDLLCPAGLATVGASLTFSSHYQTQSAQVSGLNIYGAVFAISDIGGAVYGSHIVPGTKISSIIDSTTAVLSAPPAETTATGMIVVAPPIPVIVFDHYNGDPNTIAVAVPVGTPADALNAALESQTPAGAIIEALFGVLTWQSLYDTYGDGTGVEWSTIEGKTWLELETLQ